MGFSLAVAESLTLSSTVAGALGGGGVTSTVSAEAVSARAVVGTGSEGGLLAGGTEDSRSAEPAAGETSGTRGNDGRNSDGMGRGARPGKFRGGREGRGGKPRTKRQRSHILPAQKGNSHSHTIICICLSLRKWKLRSNNTNHHLWLSLAGGSDRVKYSPQDQLARGKVPSCDSAQLREEMILPARMDRNPSACKATHGVLSRTLLFKQTVGWLSAALWTDKRNRRHRGQAWSLKYSAFFQALWLITIYSILGRVKNFKMQNEGRLLYLQETKGRQVVKQVLGNLWPSLSTWGKGKAESLRIQGYPPKKTKGMLRQ